MEEQERQLVVDQLSASRERLLELVRGLTREQWTFHPGEGRWSIGDCLEHITIVENRVFGSIAAQLAGAPQEREPTHEKDAVVTKAMPDRSVRREARAAVRPAGHWREAAELLSEFDKARARTAQFVAATDADLRAYFVPHAAFGDLDCYQWLLVLSLHGVRHARQIEEIKADPAFPRPD